MWALYISCSPFHYEKVFLSFIIQPLCQTSQNHCAWTLHGPFYDGLTFPSSHLPCHGYNSYAKNFTYFIYLFLERGKGKVTERERNINVREKHRLVASCRCPIWDQTQNVGMSPDRESNRRPFTLWDDAQPSEPHQLGLICQIWPVLNVCMDS